MTLTLEQKIAYLGILQEYVDERIYITARVDELREELERNCWWIGGSKEEIQSLTLAEWCAFVARLAADRQLQLTESPVQTELVLYLWHDAMAGHLRFSVITANHPRLPFGCRYVEAPLEDVLLPFLRDESPGFIPFSALEEVADEPEGAPSVEERRAEDFVLEVTVIRLNKS